MKEFDEEVCYELIGDTSQLTDIIILLASEEILNNAQALTLAGVIKEKLGVLKGQLDLQSGEKGFKVIAQGGARRPG